MAVTIALLVTISITIATTTTTSTSTSTTTTTTTTTTSTTSAAATMAVTIALLVTISITIATTTTSTSTSTTTTTASSSTTSTSTNTSTTASSSSSTTTTTTTIVSYCSNYFSSYDYCCNYCLLFVLVFIFIRVFVFYYDCFCWHCFCCCPGLSLGMAQGYGPWPFRSGLGYSLLMGAVYVKRNISTPQNADLPRCCLIPWPGGSGHERAIRGEGSKDHGTRVTLGRLSEGAKLQNLGLVRVLLRGRHDQSAEAVPRLSLPDLCKACCGWLRVAVSWAN